MLGVAGWFLAGPSKIDIPLQPSARTAAASVNAAPTSEPSEPLKVQIALRGAQLGVNERAVPWPQAATTEELAAALAPALAGLGPVQVHALELGEGATLPQLRAWIRAAAAAGIGRARLKVEGIELELAPLEHAPEKQALLAVLRRGATELWRGRKGEVPTTPDRYPPELPPATLLGRIPPTLDATVHPAITSACLTHKCEAVQVYMSDEQGLSRVERQLALLVASRMWGVRPTFQLAPFEPAYAGSDTRAIALGSAPEQARPALRSRLPALLACYAELAPEGGKTELKLSLQAVQGSVRAVTATPRSACVKQALLGLALGVPAATVQATLTYE